MDFRESPMIRSGMITFWTGNICQIPGTYESDCECARVITLRVGEEFPPCAECAQLITWELLARTDDESRTVRR